MTVNSNAVLRIPKMQQKIGSYDNWHVWPVTFPRRSINGRLVWGTVLRPWDGRRWIYRKHNEAAGSAPSES